MLALEQRLGALALALALVGCSAPPEEGLPSAEASEDGAADASVQWETFELTVSPGMMLAGSLPSTSGSTNPWVQGPESFVVTVGQALVIELLVNEPDRAVLVPVEIPTGATVDPLSDGVQLRWVPQAQDLGEHELTFQVVNIDDPEQVFGQYDLLLSVVPQFGLIEYGF